MAKAKKKFQFKLDQKTLIIAVISLALVAGAAIYQSRQKETVSLQIGDKKISASIEQ